MGEVKRLEMCEQWIDWGNDEGYGEDGAISNVCAAGTATAKGGSSNPAGNRKMLRVVVTMPPCKPFATLT
jgi:hypothetical protein